MFLAWIDDYLHFVVVKLVLCSNEFFFDNITQVHQILKTLVKHLVDADII